MKMMCKDCLHRDGCCNFVPAEGTIEEKAEYLYECLKKPCKDFKNKADFVEVVRCKDCKRFLEYADGKKRIEGADGDCLTRMMHGFDEQFWGVCFDDFCSYGKRKEGRSDE